MSYPSCKGARNTEAVLDSEANKKPNSKQTIDKATSPLDNPEVVELIKNAIAVLGSENAAKKWLAKPNIYQLNGQSPFAVITTNEGRKKVRSMLKTLWD